MTKTPFPHKRFVKRIRFQRVSTRSGKFDRERRRRLSSFDNTQIMQCPSKLSSELVELLRDLSRAGTGGRDSEGTGGVGGGVGGLWSPFLWTVVSMGKAGLAFEGGKKKVGGPKTTRYLRTLDLIFRLEVKRKDIPLSLLRWEEK